MKPWLIERLLCAIFGHKYRVAIRFSAEVRKLYCERCGAEFGMNDRVRVLVPWGPGLEATHYEQPPKVQAGVKG